MDKSILNTIKKLLGIPEDNTGFDTDITIHINSTFMKLNQLGIGPEDEVFSITSDEEVWSDFSEEDYTAVQSYIFLNVKLVFDPPPNSFVVDLFKQQINEYAFYLMTKKGVDISE